MGRIRGSRIARWPEAVRNASCRARAARRVGSRIVISGRSSGSGGPPPGEGRSPDRTALASAGKNGWPGGTVKRGAADAAACATAVFFAPPSGGRAATQNLLRLGQGGGRAGVNPRAVEADAVEPAPRDRPIPEHVERKRAVRGV